MITLDRIRLTGLLRKPLQMQGFLFGRASPNSKAGSDQGLERTASSASPLGRAPRQTAMSGALLTTRPKADTAGVAGKVFRTELNPVDFLERAALVYARKVALVHAERRYTYAE